MRTIFAQASARGKAGVAVLRISGPDAITIGERLCGHLPPEAVARLRLVRSADGSVLDQALVLAFHGPRSFTGEDVVEFHLHGSAAVVQKVELEIVGTKLARGADAGEFTQRALLNGKLDLVQVEGLGDLLAAETELQRRQAMQGFSGNLSRKTEDWRRLMLRAAALLEATIDFADEDVPVDVSPEVNTLLIQLDGLLRAEIEGQRVAERIRGGFEVAIIGAPNAGKSTLLNHLAQRDVALTSDVPGTTRDIVELRYDLDGIPVTFLDTAGLRDSDDHVERLGVARAMERALDADLRVLMRTEDWVCPDVLVGFVDIDLVAKADDGGTGAISGRTGEGVDILLKRISEILSGRISGIGLLSTARQRECLTRALFYIDRCREALDADIGAEFSSQHLRDAASVLELLLGNMDTESILGEIFSEFCIGK